MIKDILVSLRIGDGVDTAADYAVSAAAALNAHLTGVAVNYEVDVPPVYTEAFSTGFLESQRVESARLAEEAVARFGEASRALGLSGEVRKVDGTPGSAAEKIGLMARLYDLTIVNQSSADKMGAEEVVTEAVLFDSGRPVLLVPRNYDKPFAAKRIMVAWDGGRAASRAVAEARPLLEHAHYVEAVVVETGRGKKPTDALPGADLARHLSRHEKNVELRNLTLGSDQRVSDLLLREVVEREVDILVMGGYGHSRLREFVLGGATRDMLERMSVPVFMAH